MDNGRLKQGHRGPNPQAASSSQHPPRQVLTLVLRHGEGGDDDTPHARRRISWDSNVRDNPNQLTSKKCCVFHRKRLFGESDSDDDSSSSSEADDGENGAHPAHGAYDGNCNHHHHQHDHVSEPQASTGIPSAENVATSGATSGQPAAVATGEAVVIKRKKPRCSKEHCYCGTRFA